MSIKKTAVVIGATGNLGSAIVAALEKAGVTIKNKPVPEKKTRRGPDPKLRLALDYDRAQELLWDEEKPAAALELLDKILAQHPRDADSWFEKGNALDALGKFDGAAEAWQQCLGLKKKYPDANYNLANYYKECGMLSEAQAQIDAALANGLKSSPEAWHIRGQLQLAAGKKSTAVADLQKALKLYQKNLKDENERAEFLFQMACVSALLADTATAQDYLRQAIELDATFRKRAKTDPDLKGIA